PETEPKRLLRTTTTPRNTTPLMICTTKRMRSERINDSPLCVSKAASMETIVNKQLAIEMTTHVFKPKGLCFASLSIPKINPTKAANASLINTNCITCFLLCLLSCHLKYIHLKNKNNHSTPLLECDGLSCQSKKLTFLTSLILSYSIKYLIVKKHD